MLDAIGITDVDDLFQQIPEHLRLTRSCGCRNRCRVLQQEMERRLGAAASSTNICFSVAAFTVFIPAVVDELASRGEFYTAYTYQAEASRGRCRHFMSTSR